MTSSGLKAQADAEVSISRDGLEKILDKDKLPADLKSAKAALSVSFEDAPQACPSAAGKLPGRLHGKASITITTTSASGATTTMRLSADADMSYKVNVGEDGRWTTIDDVDMKTEFQASGTGQATQTYRGRRLGGGFGRDGILGGSGSDIGKALERDWGKIDPQKGGGVFGPKGGWNWKRGVTLNDLHSIDNVKAMVATWIATDALLLAGVEYLRAVALKRGEKYWYDDEQCMSLTGTATPASLRPKGIATVTASKAKAKDGGDVPAKLTATGTASIDPGAADLAQGGTRDFKLTAPDKKGAATWTVIGISRAGKKTVSGSIPVADDLPASFSGTVTSTFTATGIDQSWNATAPLRARLPPGQPRRLGARVSTTSRRQSISMTDDNPIPVCATYRFTGSPAARSSPGSSSCRSRRTDRGPTGSTFDVGFASAVHSPARPPADGVPGSFPRASSRRSSTPHTAPTACARSRPTAGSCRRRPPTCRQRPPDHADDGVVDPVARLRRAGSERRRRRPARARPPARRAARCSGPRP